MALQKINQKIKENLFSAQTDIVISALNTLKEKGNKLYIPLIFDLLNSNPEKEIIDEIKKLLETVKDKETVPHFIEAIKNKKYKPVQSIILATCWQNGLDFSNYLPLFIDIIINETWESSFEAFTIVDNMNHFPEDKLVDLARTKAIKALNNVNEQKAYFLNEILKKLN